MGADAEGGGEQGEDQARERMENLFWTAMSHFSVGSLRRSASRRRCLNCR